MRHACVIPLLAISTGSDLCLVMPLMDKSLETVLQDERQREACTPAQRVRYARDIFAGSAYLLLQFFGHLWALSRYCSIRRLTF